MARGDPRSTQLLGHALTHNDQTNKLLKEDFLKEWSNPRFCPSFEEASFEHSFINNEKIANFGLSSYTISLCKALESEMSQFLLFIYFPIHSMDAHAVVVDRDFVDLCT